MECQHALYDMNHYLTCILLPQQIHYLHNQSNFYQHQGGGGSQVELTHKNIEYLQDLSYHRKVLINHHYRKPY